MLTLADVQTGRFQTASGYCVSSPEFLELVNDAVTELLRRGDWAETLVPIRVCVSRGCITWPRYVGAIRKIHTCRGRTIHMRSQWYEFLDYRGPRHLHEWESWRGDERNMELQFKAPTYQDPYGPGLYIRLYVDQPADIGCTCTIFGVDNNNQPLTTTVTGPTTALGASFVVQQQSNGLWGSTTTTVSSIDRVVVSATQGLKRLYAYDSNQNALYDLAVYDPSETSPSYLRYRLTGGDRNHGNCQSSCLETVLALVKLNPIPVASPTDLVIINNRGALLDAIRAMKREDASDSMGAKQFWASAIEKLNRQLEDFAPDDQLASENNVLGGRTFSNQAF